MEGLENLKEELVKKAKSQSVTLIGAAKAEALKIIKDAEAKIEAYKKKSDEEAKQAIDSIKKKEIAAAELEAKKMRLEAKKKLIEESIESAKSKIEGMSDSKRAGVINALCKKASKDIDVATVYCNKKDSKFIKSVDLIVQDMIGGIIAEDKDGTIRVDYSFNTILESIKENNLREIAAILF